MAAEATHPALNFTDWHLDAEYPENNSIVFKGNQSLLVPEDLKDFATRFANATAQSAHGRQSFIVNIDGLKFRMQLMRQSRYAARLIRSQVPSFDDLGIRPAYKKLMLSEDLRRSGGLVIFCGQPGAGKSSTVAAMIKERLTIRGGFCLTLEDPIEFDLFGRHGDDGWCDQIDASEAGYANAITTSLRCFPSSNPSMLMLGEIRDSDAALELLRIAIDGHLVITTLHASDIITAVQRIISLASKNGMENEARSLLAGSLRLVIHQRLENKVLQMTALEGDNTVGAIIQNGSLSSLKDQIQRTQNKLSTMPL